MLVGLSEDINPFDIKFTVSKVNVTRVTCVIRVVSAHYLETYYHRAFIFHS